MMWFAGGVYCGASHIFLNASRPKRERVSVIPADRSWRYSCWRLWC